MNKHTTTATAATLRRAITHLEKVTTDELEEILQQFAAGEKPMGPLVTPPLAREGSQSHTCSSSEIPGDSPISPKAAAPTSSKRSTNTSRK